MSARVRLAGKISSVQERVSAKGNRFAFVQLTDKAGMFEATFFSEALNAARPFLDSDAPVLLIADAKQENDTIYKGLWVCNLWMKRLPCIIRGRG